MKQSLEAVYEHGAFKPVNPEKVRIQEGTRVTLMVAEQTIPEPLRLAMRVYEGLSATEIDEVENIVLDRRRFFDSRPLESIQ